MKHQFSDNEKILLMTLGLGAAIFISTRKWWSGTSGVGKVKFYKALSEAQQAGVEFGGRYDALTEDEKAALSQVGHRNNYRQTRRSQELGRSYSEAFYIYLNNKYKAVAGVGEIEYPFTEYVVRNENGDAVIIFHDYDREADLTNAMNQIDDYANDPEQYGYYATLAYLADGGKFCWESKFVGGTARVAKGVKDELFGSGNRYTRFKKEAHPEEKKRRRKILATEAKGGQYPETFAETLAEGGDSNAVRNGVLEAIRSCSTPQDAQEILLDMYYQQFDNPTPQPDYDLPY